MSDAGKKLEATCRCGNKFLTYAHLLVKGKGKHCSRKCYELSKRKESEMCRVCSSCKHEKPLCEFSKRKLRGGLCDPYCKACRAEIQQARSMTVHARWMDSKWKAKKHGDDWWFITESEYDSLLSKPCHYCKGPLNSTGVGLDRKCNDRGYILDNVVPCCGQCNIVKNDFFTYEEMMLLAPVLEAIRQGRELTCIS